MSYFHCGNGYPDRCNGYVGPLDERVCTNARHKYDEQGRQIALLRLDPFAVAAAFADASDDREEV